MHYKNYFLVLILSLASCVGQYTDGAMLDLVLLSKLLVPATTTSDDNKYIFASVSTSTGALGGISGADSICASEKDTNFASLAGSGTDYKALVVDNLARIACVSANCTTSGAGEGVDWVLQANTAYYRTDGTLIMNTDGNAVLNLSSPGLTQAFGDSGTWWTGLETDWTVTVNHCAAWTTSNGLANGRMGNGAAVNASALSDGTFPTCDTALQLLCVRQ